MGGRSRENHHIPTAVSLAKSLGGRREVKYITVLPPTYNGGGPTTVDEGTTGLFTLSTTNVDNGTTLYYSVHPTTEFVEQNGSYSITGGFGQFTLSAKPDGTVDGDVLVAVDFRTDSTSGTIVDTVSTTVLDQDSAPINGWVEFQQGTGGYTGTTDTYVQSGANESTDRSSATSIVTDKNNTNERFAMLRFDDLSAAFVDHTAVTVTSASLDLYINTEGQGMKTRTFLMDWADTDTWTSRNGDGLFTGGTGYMLSGTGFWPGVNNYTGFITIDLDAQTVQDWINDPGANKGLFIIATHPTDGQQHDSAEGATVSRRPRLHLAYTE